MNISYDSYISSIRGYERISKKQEKKLSSIINGKKSTQEEKDKAITELVEANLLLVVSRAQKVHKQSFGHHQLMDLIGEGNVALMNAGKTFNASKKGASAFGTYAVMLIDRSLYDFSRRDRSIRVPDHHFTLISKKYTPCDVYV